jgi:hypothetical protein
MGSDHAIAIRPNSAKCDEMKPVANLNISTSI